MAEEIVRIIKVDTKNSDKSINDLRKEIKGLRSELDKAVVGSEEFESTLKQLTQTQKTYNNLQQQIKDMSRTNQQDMVRFASFARNLGKAYSSLNAAIGLFANGNEDVQKAMLKVQRTIQLVQGLDGIAGLVRDLPKIANLFKGWLSFLNPIEKQVDRIAKGINGIDPKKVKLINEANINAAKVPQTTTTAAAAGGGQQQYLPAQTEELKKQATTYYPALLEQERNLQKARKVALSQLEAQRNEQTKAAKDLSVVSTNYDKIVKAIAEVKSVGFEGEAAFNLLNKKLKEANVNFEVADSNWQSLVNQLAEARNNYGNVSKQVEITTANIADLDKQIALVQKDIVTAEAGMTKFQKVLARTGVVGRTAFNMLKTAIASVGIGLLIAGVTAAVTALWKYIKNLQSAAKEQRKFNKEVSELTNKTAAKSIVVLKELSYAYQKLGDDAEAKKKFLEQYADKIKETGIAITDVKKAEDVFIQNTDKYVAAIMARAEAQAIEDKAIEEYKKYLDKRAELEANYEASKTRRAGTNSKQEYIDLLVGTGATVEQAEQAWATATNKKEQKILQQIEDADRDINDLMKRMFKDVAEKWDEYAGFFGSIKLNGGGGGNEVKEEFDSISEDLQKLIEYYKEAERVLGDEEAFAIQDIEDKYKERIDLAIKYGKDTYELELAKEKELAELQKQFDDKKLAEQRAAIEEQLQLIKDEISRVELEYRISTARLREPREEDFQTNHWFFATSQTFKQIQQQRDAEIEYNNKSLELLKERIGKENYELAKQLETIELTENEKLEIKAKMAENEQALSDATRENEIKNLEARKKAHYKYQSSVQAAIEVTGALTGAIANNYKVQAQGAEEGSEEQKKYFKKYKAWAKAQAIIDTFGAANAAFRAMADIPPAPVWGLAAAAAAIVSGMANVRAIEQESISSSTSSSFSGSSVSAPPAMQTPPIEYTRELVGDKELDKMNDPIKCYVLEAEIRSVADKVRVTEQNASF